MRLVLVLVSLVLAASTGAQVPLHDLPADAPAAPSARLAAVDALDFTWEWEPAPRWLSGIEVGFQGFDGGLDFGEYLFGSTVSTAEVPPVAIVFDRSLSSEVAVYDKADAYAYVGRGTFPGAAYDLSDPDRPRRLNLALSEDPDKKAPNWRWDPDGSSTGGYEFLTVLASDYDPSAPAPAWRERDAYYVLIGRIVSGYTVEKFDPATLTITPRALRKVNADVLDNGVVNVRWISAAYLAATAVPVYADTGEGAPALVGEVDPALQTLRLDGLDPAARYTFRVDLVDASGDVLGSETASATPALSKGVRAAVAFTPPQGVSGSYGDVWGYTAADGREYALLALRNAGLSVIDVTDAPDSAPVEVGFVPTASGASDSKDVKVYGHYAYLVNERGPLQIIDLEDPTAPVQVGTLDVQPGQIGGGAHNVLVANDHLWVVGGRTSAGAGVRAYALEDPEAPAFVGEFQPAHQSTLYYHDFEVHGSLGFGSAIYGGGGVDVLDVSDPTDITYITTFTYPGAGAHNTCSTGDGEYVFVGDEIGTHGNWIRTFDLRDLENPELVGEVVVNARAVVHNCYVRDSLLYVAHYTEGLRVFDVSDPVEPVEVAFYDTYLHGGYGYNGAWNVYPYFDSGTVIVSDIQSGLFVVALDPTATSDEPSAEPPAPLAVAPNPVAGRATARYELTEGAAVRLSVYDVQGREVAVLYEGVRPAGSYRTPFEPATLPAGVYLVHLQVDGRSVATQPVTVIR